MTGLILESMLIGIVSAFVGIFYRYSLSYNAIFGRVGKFLDSLENKGGFKGWIANPLGACVYCSTTWIAIILMTIYWWSWDILPDIPCIIICSLAAIGVQHVSVTILYDKFFK